MTANRIRELRERAQLTLDALASNTDTTNQQISHLELGKRKLTLEWMEKLAKALNCHPWALISDGGDVALTAEERKMLALFREADIDAQRRVLICLDETLST